MTGDSLGCGCVCVVLAVATVVLSAAGVMFVFRLFGLM